jgi:hypothetical protein
MTTATLLVVNPFDTSLTYTSATPPAAFGELAFGDSSDTTITGNETARYFSDIGYTSTPTDVPPNTDFAPRLTRSINFESAMFKDGNYASGAIPSVGEIVLTNADGGLDADLDGLAWDGRAVTLYQGDPTAAFSTFTQIYTGIIDALEWQDGGDVTIRLRDAASVFDRPIQTNRYTGTGGLDGDAALAGLPRPLCYGYARNIAPVLINATNLVYQVHDGAVGVIAAVRDAGSALTAGSDYPTYADLIAATVAGGTYATCLALGLFRLGGSPVGRITADVSGATAAETSASATARTTQLDTLVGYLVQTKLGENNFAAADVVTRSSGINGLDNTLETFPVALYVGTEEATVGAALSQLCDGMIGFYTIDPDGTFAFGQVAPPLDTDSVVDSFTTLDILGPVTRRDVRPLALLSLGYHKMWTVQQASDLASGISDANRQAYATPYLYKTSSDPSVKFTHRLADEMARPSLFTQLWKTGFLDLFPALYAAAVDDLYLRLKVKTGIYDVPVARDLFAFKLNQRVEVSGIGAIRNGAATKMIIIGMRGDLLLSDTVTLTLWG